MNKKCAKLLKVKSFKQVLLNIFSWTLVILLVDPDHSDTPLERFVRSAYGGGGAGGFSGSAANVKI